MTETVESRYTKLESEFLHWLLVDPEHGVIRFATEDERPCIEAVADLHKRALQGNVVLDEEWRRAWDAARDAAWDAAWAAARDAAWAAARDAARDAARAAARAAQRQKLESLGATPEQIEEILE